MLSRIYVMVALAGAVLSCTAQKSENRTPGHFNRIEVKGAIKVIFRQSDSTQVRVVADAEELQNIMTEAENGVLRISSKGNLEEAVVSVSGRELNGVEVQGAAIFNTEGEIKTGTLDINVSGASGGDIRLEAGSVSCVQTGASHLSLAGRCEKLRANVSGASSLKAFDLEAKEAEVESSGAASVKVTATERFEGNASGASTIRLGGQPKDVTAESSSAASITRVKPKGQGAGSDTVTYNWNNKKVIIIDQGKDDEVVRDKKKKAANPSKFKHWHGVMLGANGYLDATGNMELPKSMSYMDLNYARSFNIQINPIERQFYIVRHYMKIVTGLGLDLHRYELARRTTLDPDSDFTGGVVDSSGLSSFEKNKFRITYLQVPLLLEFNTSNYYKRTFHVAAGVIGQYRIGASTKQIVNSGGFEIKRKNSDDYNLNPFGLKAHVNFGYRGWTIYAEYSLTSLFKTGKGPELYPVTAGLRVIPFS